MTYFAAKLALPRLSPGSTLVLMDLDGVVNDPATSCQKPSLEVLNLTAAIQHKGAVVAAATGRPLSWVSDHILPRLPRELPPQVIAAENGAVLACGSAGALEIDHSLLARHRVPRSIFEAAESIERRYQRYLMLDRDKLAMVSLFERPGCTGFRTWFAKAAPEIKEELELGLRELGLSTNYVVNCTTIAVDVQHRDGSKALAARAIAHRLNGALGRRFSHVFAIGDSRSDIDLVRFSAENFPGADASFCYVGEGEPAASPGVRLYKSCGYSRGALAFLRALESALPGHSL